MKEAATLGKKDFAELLGLQPSYITALIKAGRVVLDGEGRRARVRVAESLALIESTTAGRFDVARRHAAARRQPPTATAPGASLRSTPENAIKRDSESRDDKSLISHKTRKEAAQADQEEFKAAEMAGSLAKVDSVLTALNDAGATVRSLCDVFPDQNAASLSALHELSDVHAFLVEAMRGFLIEFNSRLERIEFRARRLDDA